MSQTQDGATLVTGASSDIGLALLARLRGDVIAHYRSRPERFSGLGGGASITPVFGELASREGIEAFIEAVCATGLSVQKIVHLPAAPAIPERFKKFDADAYCEQLNVSALGFALVCSRFLPEMAKAGFGRVVAMLSSYVLGAPPKYLAGYVSAKYALLGLVRALAAEYAAKGITVNAVAPSMVETSFLAALPDFEIELSAKNNPLGRNAAPADVVPALELLLGEQSGYINGAVVPITAGSVM